MKNTLKNSTEYKKAYRGKRTHSANLLIITSKDENPRYGIVTPKSTGNAVARNTLQRITREALKNRTLDHTVIIVYKEGAGSLEKKTIRTELDQALDKALA